MVNPTQYYVRAQKLWLSLHDFLNQGLSRGEFTLCFVTQSKLNPCFGIERVQFRRHLQIFDSLVQTARSKFP